MLDIFTQEEATSISQGSGAMRARQDTAGQAHSQLMQRLRRRVVRICKEKAPSKFLM